MTQEVQLIVLDTLEEVLGECEYYLSEGEHFNETTLLKTIKRVRVQVEMRKEANE